MYRRLLFVLVALVGFGLISFMQSRSPEDAGGRRAETSGKGFATSELPMPAVMPVAAYDSN